MILSRLRELIRKNADIPTSTELGDSALRDYINESNLELQTELMVLETTDATLTTTQGVDNVTLPATILKATSVFHDGIKLTYLPNFTTWKELRLNVSNGTPYEYCIYNRKIHFLPPPSVTGKEIFIIGLLVPPTLTNDSDENPIPLRWFDRALVKRAQQRILEDIQEYEQAALAEAECRKEIEKAISFHNTKLNDAPTQIGYRGL